MDATFFENQSFFEVSNAGEVELFSITLNYFYV